MCYKSNIWILGSLAFILIFVGFAPATQGGEEKSTVLATDIIDRDVLDANKKLIGEVDDMIIRRSGRVKKVTVEFGGFMDLADKLVALSFKKLGLKDGKVTLDLTEKQLNERAEYNYYTQGLRPEYYYRTRPYAGPYRYPPPGYYYGPNVENPPIEPYEWALSPPRFLASAILDRRLVNKEGTEIGRVKDFVINWQDRKVEKIVIYSVDILGENVHVALPYEPIGFTAYGLVYDIQSKKLKKFIYPYKR